MASIARQLLPRCACCKQILPLTSKKCVCAVWFPAGNYDEYFGMATDVEAVVYMMLMNEMLHSLFPTAITVGEDVSGMPTLCRYPFLI